MSPQDPHPAPDGRPSPILATSAQEYYNRPAGPRRPVIVRRLWLLALAMFVLAMLAVLPGFVERLDQDETTDTTRPAEPVIIADPEPTIEEQP